MKYPKVILLNPERTNIYLRTLLTWTQENTKIQEHFKEIDFSILTKEMGEIVDEFAPVWEKAEETVMSLIPKVAGSEWNLDSTPAIFVYPIPFFHSVSHPLFLKICDVKSGHVKPRSPGLVLGMLIHELTHNCLKGLPVERSMNEALIDFCTHKVLGAVDEKYQKEYEDFHVAIGKPFDISRIPGEIVSGDVAIKNYYQKNGVKPPSA